MSSHRTRTVLSLALVFGGVIFGMVLAGGIDLTRPGVGAPETAVLPAQQISAGAPAGIPSFADLVEKVSPAVVAVEAASFETGPGRRQVDPFEFFFGPRRREQGPDEDEQEFRSESGGSGFVISEDGLVVTNNHVIRGADRIQIRLGDETYDAELKGADPATDLALLQVDTDQSLPYLPLGNSERLRVGDWVVAIGSPQGLTNTVTVGVVSAKGRRINISQETVSFEDFIQTDAAINFGNSGGPLINLQGEVVGINTAINWGSENIGFAVPVNILDQVLPQLRDEGRVRRGYLGVVVGDLTAEAAEAFGLESTDGAMVSNVLPGLPGDKAGIRHGDIIIEVDDRKIEDTRDLINYVSSKGPDATVTMEIIRDGERIQAEVELAERPSGGEEVAQSEGDESSSIEWLGLRYQDLTPGSRSMHGIPEDVEGVWITDVSPRSPLFEEGVRTGEVFHIVTEVNGQSVTSAADFEKIVGEAESGSRLRIYMRRFARAQELQPLFVFPAVP